MEIQEMTMEFDSSSSNESFARVAVAAFAARLDPTMDEITDIKTAVSEAVTNCIIHGYEGGTGKIRVECKIIENELFITVMDNLRVSSIPFGGTIVQMSKKIEQKSLDK